MDSTLSHQYLSITLDATRNVRPSLVAVIAIECDFDPSDGSIGLDCGNSELNELESSWLDYNVSGTVLDDDYSANGSHSLSLVIETGSTTEGLDWSIYGSFGSSNNSVESLVLAASGNSSEILAYAVQIESVCVSDGCFLATIYDVNNTDTSTKYSVYFDSNLVTFGMQTVQRYSYRSDLYFCSDILFSGNNTLLIEATGSYFDFIISVIDSYNSEEDIYTNKWNVDGGSSSTMELQLLVEDGCYNVTFSDSFALDIDNYRILLNNNTEFISSNITDERMVISAIFTTVCTNRTVVEYVVNRTCHTVTLSLTTDIYPDETSWIMHDEDIDILVLNGDGGAMNLGRNVTISQKSGCIEDGCYVFTLSDDYGDGILSPGGFTLYWDEVYLLTLSKVGKHQFFDSGTNEGQHVSLYFCTEQLFGGSYNLAINVTGEFQLIISMDDVTIYWNMYEDDNQEIISSEFWVHEGCYEIWLRGFVSYYTIILSNDTTYINASGDSTSFLNEPTITICTNGSVSETQTESCTNDTALLTVKIKTESDPSEAVWLLQDARNNILEWDNGYDVEQYSIFGESHCIKLDMCYKFWNRIESPPAWYELVLDGNMVSLGKQVRSYNSVNKLYFCGLELFGGNNSLVIRAIGQFSVTITQLGINSITDLISNMNYSETIMYENLFEDNINLTSQAVGSFWIHEGCYAIHWEDPWPYLESYEIILNTASGQYHEFFSNNLTKHTDISTVVCTNDGIIYEYISEDSKCQNHMLSVRVVFDERPMAVSWFVSKISDTPGISYSDINDSSVVLHGGLNNDTESYETITDNVCIDDGCYLFKIEQSWVHRSYAYIWYSIYFDDNYVTLPTHHLEGYNESLVYFCTEELFGGGNSLEVTAVGEFSSIISAIVSNTGSVDDNAIIYQNAFNSTRNQTNDTVAVDLRFYVGYGCYEIFVHDAWLEYLIIKLNNDTTYSSSITDANWNNTDNILYTDTISAIVCATEQTQQPSNIAQELEHIDKGINWTLMILLTLIAITGIACVIINKKQNRNELFDWKSLCLFLFYTINFIVVILFTVRLYLYSRVYDNTDDKNARNYWLLFGLSVAFIIVSRVINIGLLRNELAKWDNEWVKSHLVVTYIVALIIGSSFSSITLFNTYLFKSNIGNMGLTEYQSAVIQSNRVRLRALALVLCQNVVFLTIQVWTLLLALNENGDASTGSSGYIIIVLTMVLTFGCIIFSIIQYSVTSNMYTLQPSDMDPFESEMTKIVPELGIPANDASDILPLTGQYN